MDASLDLSIDIGKRSSCSVFDIPRASFYRFHATPVLVAKKRPEPPVSLKSDERQSVLDILHSEDYQDKAPYQVYASLLDHGIYHCSIRTMYRLLEKEYGHVKDRRKLRL